MKEYARSQYVMQLKLGRDEQDERQIAEERMIKRGLDAIERKKANPKAKVRKEDVDVEAREQRLNEARMLTPVIEYFKTKNRLITIDATQSITDVRKDAWKQLRALLPQLVS